MPNSISSAPASRTIAVASVKPLFAWFLTGVGLEALIWDNIALSMLLHLALWIIFAGLAFRFVVGSVRRDAWRGALFSGGAVLLFTGLQAYGAGPWCGRVMGFQLTGSTYEAIIEELQSQRNPTSGSRNGIRYEVENEPSLRVAFVLGGIMDNWTGLVHDPTGHAMEINGRSLEDPAVEGVRNWFGGQMVACRWLWGSWYFCWFT